MTNPGCFKAKYSVEDDYFEELTSEGAWLIGFLAADGSVHKNTLTFSQSGRKGLRLVEHIKKVLKYNVLVD